MNAQNINEAQSGRQVLLYFSWSRPAETSAPIENIDDRFPAIFELRRLFYPKFEPMADESRFDQGIAGFLDHVQKPNFTAFAALCEARSGRPVILAERIADDGQRRLLDDALIGAADTIIVISFDSFRTAQVAEAVEIEALRRFLDSPDKMLWICPHHDIGDIPGLVGEPLTQRRIADHAHHGDPGIPPRQGFGGFARTLLAGLGVPVANLHGLRPAVEADGTPAPIEVERTRDRLGVLASVTALNLHPHLPHFERLGDSTTHMEVLARQAINMEAPPHPFTQAGRRSFDAILQSAPGTFPGTLLVCDTTLFSSTAGGVNNLSQLWANIVTRPRARQVN